MKVYIVWCWSSVGAKATVEHVFANADVAFRYVQSKSGHAFSVRSVQATDVLDDFP